MEDRYFVENNGRFVAVFDGHGGAGVSTYLRDSLYEYVCNHLQLKHWEEADEVKNLSAPSITSHVAALRAAFEQVEAEVIGDDALQYQGSTAVAVAVHQDQQGQRTLLSANVGDSRAILVSEVDEKT